MVLNVIELKKENVFGSFMENNPIFLEFEKIGHSIYCLLYDLHALFNLTKRSLMPGDILESKWRKKYLWEKKQSNIKKITCNSKYPSSGYSRKIQIPSGYIEQYLPEDLQFKSRSSDRYFKLFFGRYHILPSGLRDNMWYLPQIMWNNYYLTGKFQFAEK